MTGPRKEKTLIGDGKVELVQEIKKMIPTEIIAQSIKDIAEAVREIRRGRLNDRGLVLLIHESCKVSKTDIQKVLNSLETLDTAYCKNRG